MDKLILDLKGQTGGQTVDVIFAGVATLRFQEKLVLFFCGELDHFILDGGAITRADSFDSTRIHGRLVQIGPNDFVGAHRRMGDPARNLFHVEQFSPESVQREKVVGTLFQLFRTKGEPWRGLVSVLTFATAKIDRPRIEPTGRPALKPPNLEP